MSVNGNPGICLVEEDSTSVDRGLQSPARVDRRVGPQRGGTLSSFRANSRGACEDVNVAQPLALLPSTQPRVDGSASVIVDVNMGSVGACQPGSVSESAGTTVMCLVSNQAFNIARDANQMPNTKSRQLGETGKGRIILEAAIITAVAVVSLTLYTFWAGRRGQDFNFLGPFLLIPSWCS